MKNQTTSTTRVKTLRSKRFTPRNAPLAIAICAALGGGVSPLPLYAAPGDAIGVEFRVNTETVNRISSQTLSSIAMDADGDFVVSWISFGQDGFGISAQRYTADGTPVGDEFLVNAKTIGSQFNPSIAMDADGDFVVSWESYNQDGDRNGIYAQRYSANGNPAGSEFRVNTETVNSQSFPSIAMDADGDFVVSWQSQGQDGSGYGIYAQRYNAGGTLAGNEFRVNTETAGPQSNPSIAMDADGDFVVSWGSFGDGNGNSSGIYAQRYNADGTPAGNEFLVNTETANNQRNPNIAMDADGDFVVSWTSYGQDGDGHGIYAQRYTADGTPAGNEFLVNTEKAGDQRYSNIVMDADGDFVVSWSSNNQDGDSWGIYAQRYNADGTPVGDEFLVNTEKAGDQRYPSIAMDADGDFVVSWRSNNQDGSGIYAQRYEGDEDTGPTVGTEFRVNTETANSQRFPSIAMDADGDFVVSWISFGQDGDSYGIYAQRYNADGTPAGNEFRVNTETVSIQRYPSIAMDADGDFVVSWTSRGQDGSGSGIYAQRYTANGTPVGNEFLVNTETVGSQSRSSIAMDADGDFVVSWESLGQDGDGSGIYAQRYTADGTLAGNEFLVNTETANSQFFPSIAMDADGDFVVSWTSSGQDGSGSGIYAQRYTADGTRAGDEFRVNTETAGSQLNPNIVMDADGDFVVSWQSSFQDGDNYGIYAQRYTADGTPAGNEFRVNTETVSIQRYPSIAMDADGDFVVSWNSYKQDGSEYGIYAQRYTANGTPVGNEFLVNTETVNSQTLSRIAMDADGDFVVSWQSYNQDGDVWGIYAQRYKGAGSFAVGTVDLNLVVQDNIDPVTAGNNFIYTVTTTNNGSGIALGNKFSTVLPDGLSYVSDDGSTTGWDCALNVAILNCNKGFLNAAEISTIDITVTANTAGEQVTSTSISSAQTDTNPSDNTDTETTTVEAAVVPDPPDDPTPDNGGDSTPDDPTPASSGGGGGSLSGFSLLMLIPLALMRRFKAEK